jgi:hypothetical protein
MPAHSPITNIKTEARSPRVSQSLRHVSPVHQADSGMAAQIRTESHACKIVGINDRVGRISTVAIFDGIDDGGHLGIRLLRCEKLGQTAVPRRAISRDSEVSPHPCIRRHWNRRCNPKPPAILQRSKVGLPITHEDPFTAPRTEKLHAGIA